MRFDDCLKFVLKWEGGKSDDPDDRGGRTCKGITQKEYTDWRRDRSQPDSDVWLITDEEVRGIYFDRYWVKAHSPKCPLPLDLVLFDSAVQHGYTRAVKWLQEALSVTPDGLWGPKTAYALEQDIKGGSIPLVSKIVWETRKDFYDLIVSRNPSQKKFYKGWMNRMDDLYNHVTEEM